MSGSYYGPRLLLAGPRRQPERQHRFYVGTYGRVWTVSHICGSFSHESESFGTLELTLATSYIHQVISMNAVDNRALLTVTTYCDYIYAFIFRIRSKCQATDDDFNLCRSS